MRFNKPYFNADAGAGAQGGGGGTTTPPATPPTSATPPATPPPATPSAEDEAKEFETLYLKGEQLSETEKAKFDALKGKYNAAFVDAEGKPLTPEQVKTQRELEAKVSTILAKPENERTPEELKFLADNTEADEPAPSVYSQVNELRGVEYDIDYGDTDPNSPEGIAIREDYIENTAREEFEKELQTKFPRAYQFFMHVSNGGKEEDFFKSENRDFKSIKLSDGNSSQQEKIVRTAFELKGISPAIMDTLVAGLKDSGKLAEVAKQELEALQAQQTKAEEARAAEVRAAREKQDKDLTDLATNVKTLVTKGFNNIVVPEKDRKGFLEFFSKEIDYHNGQIFRVKALDTKALEKELMSLYFEYKGGDLSGLVERKQKTAAAVKLKNSIKVQVTPRTQGGTNKNYIPLAEL
jgi:hypothetical protein